MKWLRRSAGLTFGVTMLAIVAAIGSSGGNCGSTGPSSTLAANLTGGGATLDSLNHTWPFNSTQALPPRVVEQIAAWAGLPAREFMQIAEGESTWEPGQVSTDPGGTHGYGLWQITTSYNNDVAAKFGGFGQMLNPIKNALAARIVFSRQGYGAWYGTKYLTDRNGHLGPLGGPLAGIDLSSLMGTSAPSSPGCAEAAVVAGGSGRNPLPGFTQSRDDAGVDACARPGMPIITPVASTLVQVISDWFSGQPLMLFRFDAAQATPSQYWYTSEQIAPVTTRIGTDFQAGAAVAHYAVSGTCTESGWGSPSANSRTLAEQQGDPGAMSPPAGSTTTWAESFKKWAGLPASWIGHSP